MTTVADKGATTNFRLATKPLSTICGVVIALKPRQYLLFHAASSSLQEQLYRVQKGANDVLFMSLVCRGIVTSNQESYEVLIQVYQGHFIVLFGFVIFVRRTLVTQVLNELLSTSLPINSTVTLPALGVPELFA